MTDDPSNYQDYDYHFSDFADDEEIGRQWAEEHFDALRGAYADSNLETATLDAHEKYWPLAQGAIINAKQRNDSGLLDEAVFHAARAFEGYVRAVFLDTVITQLFAPFDDRRKAASLEVFDLIGATLIGRTPTRLLRFSFTGVVDTPNAVQPLVALVSKTLSGNGPWRLRNRSFHTLANASRDDVLALIGIIETSLETLSVSLKKKIQQRNEDHERVLQEIAKSEEWRLG